MRFMSIIHVFGFVAGIGLGVGCKSFLWSHCANNEGDNTCAANGDDRGYCNACIAENDGCTNMLPQEGCHFEGGSSETGGNAGADSGMGSAETSADESMDPSLDSNAMTGGMPGCAGDDDCIDPTAPVCAEGRCVACDAVDAPEDPCVKMGLVCMEGMCVGCIPACTGEMPVCDYATSRCICAEHEQCASGACDFLLGTCFPSDVVVHVDGDDDSGRVFTSVTEAVSSVGAGSQGVIIVHEVENDSYEENVIIDGAKHIALLAAPGDVPAISGNPFVSGLTLVEVNGVETVVYIDRVQLMNGFNARGLRVNEAFARVDRSQIVRNDGRGVVAVNGATVELRNTIVGGNGDALPFYRSMGVDVADSTALILYSTVANNLDIVAMGEDEVDSIRCNANSTVEVRNSIVVDGDPDSTIDCPGIVITNSALDEVFGDNVVVGPAQDSWFVDPAAGNFLLSSTGMPNGAATFVDIAQWTMGDPTTDIDGDLRPAVDGMPDYAGADVP